MLALDINVVEHLLGALDGCAIPTLDSTATPGPVVRVCFALVIAKLHSMDRRTSVGLSKGCRHPELIVTEHSCTS